MALAKRCSNVLFPAFLRKSCSRDEPFTQGFNPDIRFARTQTIMQGAVMCDFRLTVR